MTHEWAEETDTEYLPTAQSRLMWIEEQKRTEEEATCKSAPKKIGKRS